MNLEEKLAELEQKEVEKEMFQSDYKMPSSNDFNPVEHVTNYMEEKQKKFKEMMDRCFKKVNDEIKIDKTYSGTICEVDYEPGNLENINVIYELIDDGQAKYVCDTYTFGGEWDSLSGKRLAEFIKRIKNFYSYDLNLSSPENIANSLKVLVGSKVLLKHVYTY